MVTTSSGGTSATLAAFQPSPIRNSEEPKFVRTPGDDVSIYSLHPDALGNLDCTIRPLKLRRN